MDITEREVWDQTGKQGAAKKKPLSLLEMIQALEVRVKALEAHTEVPALPGPPPAIDNAALIEKAENAKLAAIAEEQQHIHEDAAAGYTAAEQTARAAARRKAAR